MRIGLALLLVLTLAGCATTANPSKPSPSTGPSTSAAWPEGQEYTTTTVTESGQSRSLVAGTTLSVRFGRPYELHIIAGCNQLGVSARLAGDRIIPGDFVSTAMGCDADRLAQDRWVVAFFTAQPAYAVTADELRLWTEATEISLRRRDR